MIPVLSTENRRCRISDLVAIIKADINKAVLTTFEVYNWKVAQTTNSFILSPQI